MSSSGAGDAGYNCLSSVHEDELQYKKPHRRELKEVAIPKMAYGHATAARSSQPVVGMPSQRHT